MDYLSLTISNNIKPYILFFSCQTFINLTIILSPKRNARSKVRKENIDWYQLYILIK